MKFWLDLVFFIVIYWGVVIWCVQVLRYGFRFFYHHMDGGKILTWVMPFSVFNIFLYGFRIIEHLLT